MKVTGAVPAYCLLALAFVTITLGLANRTAQDLGAGSWPAPNLTSYPWFYLRDRQPLADNEVAVELIAVGDVMLGRGVSKVVDPLNATVPWLAAADLTLGNLESVITEKGKARTVPPGGPQPYLLKAPVAAISHLADAGFDVLSLANNHSLDYGPEALADTAARLQRVGIIAYGAGPGADAYRPVILQVKGVELAFLAFNAVPEPNGNGPVAADSVLSSERFWTRAEWDEARAVAAVAAVRQQVDAVIVSVHWGYEYELWADPWQKKAAQALLAAGADLVIGHHPHVVQEVEIAGPAVWSGWQTEGRVVAYSLGNFVFDQTQGDTNQGLVLRSFFDVHGLRAVQALPVWSGLRPRLMAPDEGASLLTRIQPVLPRLVFACQAESCYPVDGVMDGADRTAPTGRFWSGTIDLTGDGKAELVRRAGEMVTVYQEGKAVWYTPPDWRVTDVALGDPNDDGRAEMLLAIWRVDKSSFERSQPYIVGYRRGEYRLLWGGRPVTSPILEVELGDVDGDGTQELVVLEAQDDAQSVSVWRWQGWSFSLVWRSPYGRYRDLVLLPGSDKQLVLAVMTDSMGLPKPE